VKAALNPNKRDRPRMPNFKSPVLEASQPINDGPRNPPKLPKALMMPRDPPESPGGKEANA
jgi:hypothetical protein